MAFNFNSVTRWVKKKVADPQKSPNNFVQLTGQSGVADTQFMFAFNYNLREFLSDDPIDIDMIEFIHGIERQQDGYISLCSQIDHRHHDIAGIRIIKLREIFPVILEFLLENAYFSVNASFKTKPYKTKMTGQWAPERREVCLRYLNATYVDLDFYKSDTPLDWPKAVEIVQRAQEEGDILPATVIGKSGRGAYLLWVLTSERYGAQQRAFPHEIDLYKEINKALIKRLNEIDPRLNCDQIAFDGARILRIPGSINTKANEKVKYLVQATDRGFAPVYTLKKFAEFFSIPVENYQMVQSEKFHDRLIKETGSCPARRIGRLKSASYRVLDILKIFQNMNGFPQGNRRRFITIYIQVMKTAGVPRSEILDSIKKLASGCRPPYPSDPSDIQLEKLLDDIWIQQTRKFYNHKLAREFGITPELAVELNLRSIIPKETRENRKALPSIQEQKRIERKAMIKEILIDRPGYKPSLREMEKLLLEYGISTCKRTVQSDIKQIFENLSIKDF